MGSQRTITCGACKKRYPAGSAHNARTCGKPKKNPRKITTHTTQSSPSGEGEASQGWSSDILDVWWELKNGERGKRGKGKSIYSADFWTMKSQAELLDFVKSTESSDDPPTVKQWRGFFKNIGSEPKRLLLFSYDNVQSFSRYVINNYSLRQAKRYLNGDINLDEEDEDTQRIIPSGDYFNRPINGKTQSESLGVLPEKLFTVFSYDSSAETRDRLAELEGLPQSVKSRLLDDRSVTVLTTLALRSDVTSEDLTYLYRRAESGTLKCSAVKLEELYTAIAVNPATPTSVLSEYFTKRQPLGSAMVAAAGNPNTPRSLVRQTYSKHLKAFEEIMENPYARKLPPGFGSKTQREQYVARILWYAENASPKLTREQIKATLQPFFTNGMYGASWRHNQPSEWNRKVGFASWASNTAIESLLHSRALTGEDMKFYYDNTLPVEKSCPSGSPVVLAMLVNPRTPKSVMRDQISTHSSSQREPHTTHTLLASQIAVARKRLQNVA